VRRVCGKLQVPQDARIDDPGARSSTRKGARNRSQKAARFPSLGRSDPWPVRVVARRPSGATQSASDTPTQPASFAGEQRSESPARARGSDARRVCPRVVYGCRSRQAMSRVQRSASRWQRDAWTGARPTRTQEGSRGSNGIDSRCRGGKAASPGRPEPGAREGVAGRRSLPDGRHSGSSFRSASIHASAPAGGLGPSQEGRQGCQRLGRPANAGRSAEVNRSAVKQASPRARKRRSLRRQEPTRRGCSYEDVRWQKSVRRIARRVARGAARRFGRSGAGQGALRTSC